MHPAFYMQDKVCPVCGAKIKVTKIRSGSCPVASRDTDFCVHYTGPVNPNLYGVWLCPNCGYAASDGLFDEIDLKGVAAVKAALAGRAIPHDSPTDRTPELAIELIKQAIFCAEQWKVSRTVMAGLNIRIAWMYRELRDPREEEFLAKALDLYQEAYDRERFPVGKMTAATVGYLIGELKRKLGHLREATEWLSRLASDPRLKAEPSIDRLVRNQWQEAKAALGAGLEGKTSWDDVRPESSRPIERLALSVDLDGEAARWVRQVYDQVLSAGSRVERADIVKALSQAIAETIDPARLAGSDYKDLVPAIKAILGGKTA